MLINYKVELSVLRKRLPAPFRPRSYRGYGIAGQTLMLIPSRRLWVSHTNALLLHRIEAEAIFPGMKVAGSYVVQGNYQGRGPSRGFSSMFPMVMEQERIRLDSIEGGQYLIEAGRKEDPWMRIRAHQGTRFPFDSIMPDLETANQFVKQHEAWFAPRYRMTMFEQRRWETSGEIGQPLLVDRLDTPQFAQIMGFPTGAFFFDHALIFEQVNYRFTAPTELIAPRTEGFLLE